MSTRRRTIQQPHATFDLLHQQIANSFLPWEKEHGFDTHLPRVFDPAWHIGHITLDYNRALLEPFGVSTGAPVPFPTEEFLTATQSERWRDTQPVLGEVLEWLWLVDDTARKVLSEVDHKRPLDQPVKFFTMTAMTVEDAVFYVTQHSAFHLGRAFAH